MREVDALSGEMAKNIDSLHQMKMLNTGKVLRFVHFGLKQIRTTQRNTENG